MLPVSVTDKSTIVRAMGHPVARVSQPDARFERTSDQTLIPPASYAETGMHDAANFAPRARA
jgi:hypothetical protein